MPVIASLVLGSDGSSTVDGSSVGLSTPADRARFLTRRRLSDAILIGGTTARSEGYSKTPVPLVILSRSKPSLLEENPLAHWWPLSPIEAVAQAQKEFGQRIAIEGGIAFIVELLRARLISQLDLTITLREGGENKIDPQYLIAYFTHIEREQSDETIFYTCTLPL